MPISTPNTSSSPEVVLANVPATATQSGYLSAADWVRFNAATTGVSAFTTLGGNLTTVANPSAITFLRANANNTVSALSAMAFREAIGVDTMAAPTAETTGAVTLTLAKLLTKLITGTPTAACAYTLDTGANMDATGIFSVNSCFDWTLQNNDTTANTDIITLTGDIGHTIVGSPLVYPYHVTNFFNCTARFRTRKTAANTFVTYRLA